MNRGVVQTNTRISDKRAAKIKGFLEHQKIPPESINMILSGNFSMKNFLASKGKLVNGKVVV